MNQQRDYLIFTAGGREFACAFENILRIEAAGEITPAPGFPDYMPGTAEIDGEIIPVIDAAKRFGLNSQEDRSRSCFIVAFTEAEEGGISAEYKKCALLADSVKGSLERTDGELLPPPAVNSDSFVKYVTGMISDDGKVCYVIAPQLTIGD